MTLDLAKGAGKEVGYTKQDKSDGNDVSELCQ